jgi:lon-related putative ATP-dependent protease
MLIKFVGIKEPEGSPDPRQAAMMAMLGGGDQPDPKEKMLRLLDHLTQVKLLVNNQGNAHPPVIHAKVPKFAQLFGTYHGKPTKDGGVIIDHTMIEPGDLLKANGGYLILDLRDLLRWSGGIGLFKLLQVIRDRRLSIERIERFAGYEGMVKFRPQDVEVDVRIVLICDHMLARLLRHYEPEFDNLFRVNAEFESEMDITGAPAAYTAFVEACQISDDLPVFSKEAIARLVEYGVRRAGDQTKVSLELGVIKDVMTEAAHWAKSEESETVEREHVHKALKLRFHRRSLAIRRYQRHLDNGTFLWSQDGMSVGQGNGLAVLGISKEVTFGIPSRITGRAYAGKGGVILVQEENKTSGPSTTGAIAVIRGLLSGRYGRKKPLGLTVQLNFEQNYGGVNGDSASLIKTAITLSAISELPIDQRFAVTGSMNQWGEAQPIGGVNYKIEGHFSALKRRGLLKPDSGHGAIIPIQNVKDLMLDQEVVEAVRQELYTIYAVSHVDEVLELLMHKPIKTIDKTVKKKLKAINGEKPGFFARLFSKKDD